ncbi:MAG: hypothetical protein M1826_005894 [Phylliscum demangeonii]|nr:MAG: hypothetical protein M1826_005894 [Phylliscum demangeonii]
MATDNPDLRAELQQLDRELEKRRTLILSHYGASPAVEPLRVLRIHSPDDQPYRDGSRSGSFAALTANTSLKSGSPPALPRLRRSQDTDAGPLPPGMVESFQDTRLGEPITSRQDSLYHRESLFLPGPDRSGASSRQAVSRDLTLTPDYAFNPATQGTYGEHDPDGYEQAAEQGRVSTMLDSQQNYFLDFAGQQGYDPKERDSYGVGPHRYSNTEAFSPVSAPPLYHAGDFPSFEAIKSQLPLEPRDVPFAVYDPHDGNVPMSRFDNLPSVLRYRGRANAKRPAYWVLDSKGKEIASITWEKLASRAEKVAQVIRDKSNLYRGDRVALIYRDTEVIEFAVALMGCFVAGVVAVPINNHEDYQKLNFILTSTQAHLALTTDNNLKAFQRDITTQKLTWPRGVEWWKTNDFHPKKKEDVPPLSIPDLAYIEFSRGPTGEMRGVVLSHRTIMHQMACLSATIATVPTSGGRRGASNSGLRDKNGRLVSDLGAAEIMLSYLDPRQGIGMIMAVLLTVYGGHTTVWMESRAVETPGLYANIVTKYKATLMLADYPGLKRTAYNYQTDPMATRNFKKNMEPNFSSVKLCLIDTLTVDSEFHEILADRWLRPMRNPRAREIVAPMLCLPEHGGMVISMRDWLGGEERMGCPLNSFQDSEPAAVEEKKQEGTSLGENGYSSLIGSGTTQPKTPTGVSELSEVLLDREALKTNEVVVVAMGEDAKKRAGTEPGTVRVGAFGYPLPDATLAVVDPETSLLCTPYVIGEIWVDSPSLSGGFWALPRHTENIFHARAYRFEDGNPTPMMVDPEFLRTGLLGCVIDGRIFVLGLYEDRLRQKVEWVEHDVEIAEYRYFFVQHLIVSIMKNVPKIYDCSAFDTYVNEEHLPIVLLESAEASTSPQSSGGPPRPLDIALLDSLSERCMEVLYQEHHLRVYCVMITAPNSLPRVFKNGRNEIGNMLCRRDFDNGSLACVHVKFGVERAVLNLPVGIDPVGGIWSRLSTQARQEVLMMHDKQYSGVDYHDVVIDDRTSTPLNNFASIVDLLQWRVSRQTDDLSYCTVDGRGKEGKGITWKKLDAKIAAVAMYLHNKVKVRPGNHVVLMYTHSEEFVYAVHACFCLGVIAIPMAPLDQNRLHEDAPAFLHLVAEFGVRALLVNNDVDHLLKQKTVSQHLRQSASVLRIAIPNVYNTSKPPKQSVGCRDLGLTVKPAWVQPEWPVLIWAYWTPDQRRILVQLGHDTILGACAPTYLVSPLDFAQNPISLFLILSRYKIKDTYATGQMLDHAMSLMPGKGFTLHELKNLMIATEGRPRVDVFQKVRLHFAATGLDRTAINTIYSHVLNPMVASRSYMCIEPIELWLDRRALRQGLVQAVEPESDPSALLVQDSGMVPVSTQIAIVNPESCLLCHIGEYGEIWVSSEASVKSFYGSKDALDAARFDGRTVDGDPCMRYVRTGDLGFLHTVSRPIGPGGAQVEMQILFVLGSIGETFEVMGLSHFPIDIESTVERCHRNIVPGGCAIFQAGKYVVVVVEVVRKAYLASIVPVIVNAILNGHQLVIDIVAFVSKGDFPRSRLGEKQRGKILASWVTRKLQTVAQFGIRDARDALDNVAEPEAVAAAAAARHSSSGAASLSARYEQHPGGSSSSGNMTTAAHSSFAALPSLVTGTHPLPHTRPPSQQHPPPPPPPQQQRPIYPSDISELPAVRFPTPGAGPGADADADDDETPTNASSASMAAPHAFELPGTTTSPPPPAPPSLPSLPSGPVVRASDGSHDAETEVVMSAMAYPDMDDPYRFSSFSPPSPPLGGAVVMVESQHSADDAAADADGDAAAPPSTTTTAPHHSSTALVTTPSSSSRSSSTSTAAAAAAAAATTTKAFPGGPSHRHAKSNSNSTSHSTSTAPYPGDLWSLPSQQRHVSGTSAAAAAAAAPSSDEASGAHHHHVPHHDGGREEERSPEAMLLMKMSSEAEDARALRGGGGGGGGGAWRGYASRGG